MRRQGASIPADGAELESRRCAKKLESLEAPIISQFLAIGEQYLRVPGGKRRDVLLEPRLHQDSETDKGFMKESWLASLTLTILARRTPMCHKW